LVLISYTFLVLDHLLNFLVFVHIVIDPIIYISNVTFILVIFTYTVMVFELLCWLLKVGLGYLIEMLLMCKLSLMLYLLKVLLMTSL